MGAPTRRRAARRSRRRRVLAERAVAELRAIYAWVAARPVETAEPPSSPRLGRGLGTDRARWAIHFYAIRGPYQVMDDLADLYESVVEAQRRARRSG